MRRKRLLIPWLVCLGLSLVGIACATTAPHQAAEQPPRTSPTSGDPAALVDAQYAAIVAGDLKAAFQGLAPSALFSGPLVDQVAVGDEARRVARHFFGTQLSSPFSPVRRVRHVGGAELPAVRWLVDRFGQEGRQWSVFTLLVRGERWEIAAQSWDIADDDQRLLARSRAGELPAIGAVAVPSTAPVDPAIEAWVERLSTEPTRMTIPAPLRGDTVLLGTSGEYAQGDEACLTILAQNQAAIDAGHMTTAPLAGRALRLFGDGAAGVAVFHVAMTLTARRDGGTLPIRGVAFFVHHADGPRYVGLHFVTSP